MSGSLVNGKAINSNEDVYLVGDVRFSKGVSVEIMELTGREFLKRLQNLMEEFGVVKIDLGVDPLSYPS